jgi:quinone-modifying oxidoreductase subunit QmoC
MEGRGKTGGSGVRQKPGKMLEVKPDIQFKRELGRLSGSPLNQCMQCGRCSAVCSLAPAERPFPSKEMIWAGWGLKDRLLGNVDVWLCHQCGDCSKYCPRDVKPADVVAAVRQQSYLHYARPRFIGRLVSRPEWLPAAVLLPVAVIILVLAAAGTLRIPGGPVDYSQFFPHAWLNSSFSLITLAFYGMAFSGIVRFWHDMKRLVPFSGPAKRPVQKLFPVLREIFSHSSFSGCESNKPRKIAHMLVFFGFGILLLVTLYAIVATQTGDYPMTFRNPFKIAGNVASLMIYTGLGIMIQQRLSNRKVFGKSNYTDWLLLVSIALLTLSGTLVEWARLGNWSINGDHSIAYYLYFFHLVTVWFVIIYLPYTKLGHFFYRTAALLYARSIGRK